MERGEPDRRQRLPESRARPSRQGHQSGRDADVGYYFIGNQFARFKRMTADNIDLEKTWFLIETLLETGRVKYVLMDYDIQRVFYDYLAPVYPDWRLAQYFQYPRPRSSNAGVIRHAPRHADHLHVRFHCPIDDERCVE